MLLSRRWRERVVLESNASTADHLFFWFTRQQSEEGERNGSEEEDEEKPGKRVMGPRKKFVWDDKLR